MLSKEYLQKKHAHSITNSKSFISALTVSANAFVLNV